MGINTTGLTRPIVVWDLKSLKGTQFGEKCIKLKFHYFTIVHLVNSLVKIKCQIYVAKSSWNDPKSILSIKVCTLPTFFKYNIEKSIFFEKLTRLNASLFSCFIDVTWQIVVLVAELWLRGFLFLITIHLPSWTLYCHQKLISSTLDPCTKNFI